MRLGTPEHPHPVPVGTSGGNFYSHKHVESPGAVVKDDAQLIDETLAGQSMAFGQLVTKYQDRLYTTVTHVVGSEHDARDIVQDAFVQAFVKLDTFRRTSAFYTWLYRIAFNLAISFIRRQRPTVSIERTREAIGEEPADDGPAPEDTMQQKQCAEQVKAALAMLNEEHRTILVLREIDGCCYETIAEILELPVGTVRSRLHRARMQMREQLREVLQGDLR